jgi:hypothetical protein
VALPAELLLLLLPTGLIRTCLACSSKQEPQANNNVSRSMIAPIATPLALPQTIAPKHKKQGPVSSSHDTRVDQ